MTDGPRSTDACVMALAVSLFVATEARAQPSPLPKPPGATCPSNYSVSGQYCVPNRYARDAKPKVGATCPSGWYVSGPFCVSQTERRR
jgi:hypothetical protein